MKQKVLSGLRRGADGVIRAVTSPKVVATAVVAAVVTLPAMAQATEDANELLVDGAVTNLTATFATVFTLGLGVAVALIAKKYLRRGS